MIHVHSLTRRFDRMVAVDSLNLDVAQGELYGFLGPNGAGKTTAIRMLNGLLRPSSGTITIDAKSWQQDATHIRRITGLIPDTPPLYEYLTGRQYVSFVASLYGVDPAQSAADAEPLYQGFDLADKADELCKAYSHGMKKKAHIIAVLVTRPRVLFLDEPTTGLDPRSARFLKDLLREYCDEGGTAFLTTHILDVAERICDRIGIIDGGSLLAEGTMAELRAPGAAESLEDIFLRLTEDEPAGSTGAAPAAS